MPCPRGERALNGDLGHRSKVGLWRGGLYLHGGDVILHLLQPPLRERKRLLHNHSRTAIHIRRRTASRTSVLRPEAILPGPLLPT